jgi:hypothetical protein
VDLNADGKLDIVVTNQQGVSTASVLLGNGDGTFGAYKTISPVVAGPNGLVAKDVNGDGKPDLVIAGGGAGNMNNVGLLLGNGDGTFQAQQTFTAGMNPAGVWVGDINGDGLPDAIVGNQGSNNLTYLQGMGAQGFAAGVTVEMLANSGPQIVAVADLNNDKLLDVVTANNGLANVSILLQQCK